MNNNLMVVINRKRIEKKKSISEFCSELGIDEATYNLWVNNPDSITLSTFRKISDHLGFTVNDLKDVFC